MNVNTKINEKNDKKNEKKNKYEINIWLLLLLLLLLVLSTGALTYSIISSYSDGIYNVITLVPGDDGSGDLPDYNIVTDPDGNEIWEFESSIDLFKSSYVNEFGEVTVDSNDGTQVVAPGTSNIFVFSLKNSGNISMDFVMKLEGLFELSDYKLPFQVRLRSENKWLIGDHSTWVDVDELELVEVKNTIDRGKYLVYILEWQWPFETDSENDKILADLNDTIIGNQGSLTDLQFCLSINTKAQITEGAQPYNQNGLLMITEIVPKGLLYTLLILLIIILLILIFFFSKKRKKEDDVDEKKKVSKVNR